MLARRPRPSPDKSNSWKHTPPSTESGVANGFTSAVCEDHSSFQRPLSSSARTPGRSPTASAAMVDSTAARLDALCRCVIKDFSDERSVTADARPLVRRRRRSQALLRFGEVHALPSICVRSRHAARARIAACAAGRAARSRKRGLQAPLALYPEGVIVKESTIQLYFIP